MANEVVVETEVAGSTPASYIDGLDEPRRTEVRRLHELITSEAPGLEPHIAYGMLAYGRYHYRYKTGREGDWQTIGLASRKNYISLYINAWEDGGTYLAESYRDRLPKADIGKSCVRIKRLSDLDEAALTELIRRAAATAGDHIES